MNDLVHCVNCGTLQVILLGSDICLNCHKDNLNWYDPEVPEVDSAPGIVTGAMADKLVMEIVEEQK